jgi:hypothetical protein
MKLFVADLEALARRGADHLALNGLAKELGKLFRGRLGGGVAQLGGADDEAAARRFCGHAPERLFMRGRLF